MILLKKLLQVSLLIIIFCKIASDIGIYNMNKNVQSARNTEIVIIKKN